MAGRGEKGEEGALHCLVSSSLSPVFVNSDASVVMTQKYSFKSSTSSAFCDGTSRYGVPENLTTG